MGNKISKSLWRSLTMLMVLVFALILLLPTAALADTGPAQFASPIPGGKVVITNNYNAADVVEVILDSAPAAANAVFWVYLPGVQDKGAQLGSITVKKGMTTGKLSVPVGKFKDFSGGSVKITTEGSEMYECTYGPAGLTTFSGTVTLRNCENAAALLIVDKNAVIPGMTVTAIVNGKMYKGTTKTAGVEFQLALAKGLEEGTPVWYTVAAPGCADIGYNNKLVLGPVEIGQMPVIKKNVFFQGADKALSSIMLIGLSPGDTVRCYRGTTLLGKPVTVASGSNVATLAGLKLTGGESLDITVAQKGTKESPKESITVPTLIASTALKTTDVKAENKYDDDAEFTVKTRKTGDIVNIYDMQGNLLDTSAAATADLEEVSLFADVGNAGGKVYLSITASGSGESPWFSLTVKAATAPVGP